MNFVFRMEKLAGTLGGPCLLSDSAAAAFKPVFAWEPIGDHALLGFNGSFAFFGAEG